MSGGRGCRPARGRQRLQDGLQRAQSPPDDPWAVSATNGAQRTREGPQNEGERMATRRREGDWVPFVRVLRPAPGGQVRFGILSDQIQGWRTHWTGEQDAPCGIEFSRVCQHCIAGVRTRLTWYALAIEETTRDVVIATITAGAMEHCDELIAARDNARGLIVTLKRGKGQFSAVKALVNPKRFRPADSASKGVDLRDAVCRLWGLTRDGLPMEREAAMPISSGGQETSDEENPFGDAKDPPPPVGYRDPAEVDDTGESEDQRFKRLWKEWLRGTKDPDCDR